MEEKPDENGWAALPRADRRVRDPSTLEVEDSEIIKAWVPFENDLQERFFAPDGCERIPGESDQPDGPSDSADDEDLEDAA